MPLVKKTLSIAAGATSEQVLAGTTYEYLDSGTQVRIAACQDTAPTAIATGDRAHATSCFAFTTRCRFEQAD